MSFNLRFWGLKTVSSLKSIVQIVLIVHFYAQDQVPESSFKMFGREIESRAGRTGVDTLSDVAVVINSVHGSRLAPEQIKELPAFEDFSREIKRLLTLVQRGELDALLRCLYQAKAEKK